MTIYVVTWANGAKTIYLEEGMAAMMDGRRLTRVHNVPHPDARFSEMIHRVELPAGDVEFADLQQMAYPA